jgi:phage tail sheath gpL-like
VSISFDNIPTTLRVPFVFAEFNSSRAQQGPSILPYKGLLIGQKLAAGTATADTVVKVTNVDQVIVLGGRGSMLHRQALGWFASNRSTELWLGVLADNGAGVAATGTIVFTAAATGSGTIAFYLGGERVTVGVASGAATTTMATDTGAAINANLDLPVTASVSGSTVTLLFRHKGQVGNTYDIRHSYRDGEALPAGVAVTITTLGGVIAGTTNPTLTTLIAAMADLWFQIWSHPYTDATSLTAIEADLLSRFGPLRSIDGIAITSASGSFGTLSTLGSGRNSQQSVIVAQPGASPLTPPMEFASEVAGLVALYGAADPARPFQTLAMSRALPVVETDQFSDDERNLLLYAGIATTKRVAGGIVQLERIITTYRTSPSGAADTSYLDVTTMLTLLYLRYSFRVRIQNRYPRHKLANDDVLAAVGSGQAIITPRIGKAEALMWFRENERLGLVEGFEQFKRDVVCERDAVDPNRLNWLLPPDLINFLCGAAAQIQFRL